LKDYSKILIDSIFKRKRIIAGVAIESVESLIFLTKLIEEDRLKGVIDKTYTLDEIVKANMHVDTEHKKGNVVLSIK
jgi:NADPH:quinone reductase-like Zn-dependent oxidoreductase